MVDPTRGQCGPQRLGDVLLPDHLGEGRRAVLAIQSQRHGSESTSCRTTALDGSPVGRWSDRLPPRPGVGPVTGHEQGTPAPVRAHGPLLPSGPGGVDEMDAAGVRPRSVLPRPGAAPAGYPAGAQLSWKSTGQLRPGPPWLLLGLPDPRPHRGRRLAVPKPLKRGAPGQLRRQIVGCDAGRVTTIGQCRPPPDGGRRTARFPGAASLMPSGVPQLVVIRFRLGDTAAGRVRPGWPRPLAAGVTAARGAGVVAAGDAGVGTAKGLAKAATDGWRATAAAAARPGAGTGTIRRGETGCGAAAELGRCRRRRAISGAHRRAVDERHPVTDRRGSVTPGNDCESWRRPKHRSPSTVREPSFRALPNSSELPGC